MRVARLTVYEGENDGNPLINIVAGVVAIYALRVARGADAIVLIQRQQPFQAVLGGALLATAINAYLSVNASYSGISIWMMASMMYKLTVTGGIVCAIWLGILFVRPMLVRLTAASGVDEGIELGIRIAPQQALWGYGALGFGFLGLLYAFDILMFMNL